MPGHSLHVRCRCGFERELYVGSTRKDGRWMRNVIAYNENESDLLSDTEGNVTLRKLRIIPDPFRANETDGPWGVESIVRTLARLPIDLHAEEHGPYLCPRCKADSLMVRYGVLYD